MDIYWYGQACFKLKGKTTTVVIDPYEPNFTGLKVPKDLEADVILTTHQHLDHNNIRAVKPLREQVLTFSGPGEYEIGGVVITGVLSYHDDSQGKERGNNTIFHLLCDGLNIVHLGDLGQSKLTESQIQQISQTDILLIPVGGIYTIGEKQAAEIVEVLEPKIIIPMHYKIDGLKFDLGRVDKFLKEMGQENVETQAKLSITKEKLPEDALVVVLKNG